MSDQAGRFGFNGGKNGMKGYGEPHSIEQENKRRLIKQIAENTARANGLTAAVEYERGYPVLFNDPKMVDFAEFVINRLPGHPAVVHIKNPLMGGEDFAYFLQKAPGAFLRLGSCKDAKTAFPWHHPRFNIDEEVLPQGAKLLAELAQEYLSLPA